MASQKRTNDTLQEYDDATQALLNAFPGGAVLIDVDGTIVTVNNAAVHQSGKRIEELIGAKLFDLFPSDLAKARKAHIDEVVRSGKSLRFQDVRDGTRFDHSLYPLFDQRHQVHQVAIFSQNITEMYRVQTEHTHLKRQVDQQARTLSGILSASADLIYVFDKDMRYKYVNLPGARALGMSPQDIVGKTWKELGLPRKSVRHMIALADVVFATGRPQTEELQWENPDGATLYYEYILTPIFNARGEAESIVSTSRDITARKRAEENAEFLAKFPEENPNPVMRLNAKGELLYSNKAAQKLLGDWDGTAGGTAPQPLFDVTIDALSSQANKTIEVEVRSCVFEFVISVTDAGYANVYGRDVTERKRAEAALQQAHNELEQKVTERTEQLAQANMILKQEIEERKQAEAKVARLNRLYTVLSKTNEAMWRIHEPKKLYNEMCRIVVEDGLFRMAWIGRTEPDTHLVTPVAYCGVEEGYLDSITISAEDVPEGRGPTGTAIREGRYDICNDFEHDSRLHIWRAEALKRGYRSSAAFPLKIGIRVIGALTLYANEPLFFNDEEIQLLERLSDDIAFAIEFIEHKEELMQRGEMLDLATEVIMIVDLDDTITYWNKGAERLYGWTRGEAIGQNVHELLQTEYPESLDDMLSALYRDGAWDGELIHTTRDNTRLIVESHWTLYRDSDGKPSAIFEVNNDVTEQKQAEEKVRAASLYSRSLIEVSLDPLVTISAEGKITDVNKATEEVTGFSREDLIGSDFSSYFTEPVKAKAGYREVFSTGYVRDYPLAIRHKSGRITDVLYNATVYRNDAGEIQGVFAAARDITERKKSEEALIAERDTLETVTKNVAAGLAIISRDYRTVWVNTILKQAYGEVEGKLCYEVYNQRTEVCPGCGAKQIFETGIDKAVYERESRDDHGNITWSQIIDTAMKDKEGNIVGVLKLTMPITEQKQAEEKVRAASLYSRSLIEASLDPLVTISAEGTITDVNKATEDVTGFSREELIGSDFSSYFTEPKKAKAGYRKVFADGFVRDYSLAIRHKSGRITDVLYNATLYKNEAGEIQGVFAAARDVTERKRADEKVRAASLYARSLIEASLDPLVTISAEGTITDVNKATEDVTGFSREELIGSDFSNYFTDPADAKAGYRKVFADGFVRDYPLAIRHKSGGVTDVLYNATLYRNEAGEIQGVFAAARDVTERKQAEAEIARRGEMLDLANDAITIRDVNDCITYWNRGAEHLYGWKEEEVLGMVTHELFQTVFPESLDVTKQALYRDGVWNGELIHTTRDNARIIVESHWTLYHERDGKPSAIFEVNNDVTERKQAQEALKRAHDELEQIVKERTHELQEEIEEHKVTEGELRTTTEELRELTEELREKAEELTRSNQELEQFAYIASHDLQEPLRTVASSIGLLENWYEGKLGAEADTFIGYAVDGTKQMQQLIKDLLAYSRVTSRGESFVPLHFEDVAQHAIDNLKTAIEESGATITLPKQPLPMMMGDKTQLVQLFQNLVGNAIKFRSERPSEVRIGVERAAGHNEWLFSVRDNGIGMDMQYADKIFTIFQRLHTTEEYPGTGVGLALCKKIVERHGGQIWVESEPGKGSTFYFTLPSQ